MSAVPSVVNTNAPVVPMHDKKPLAFLLDAAVQKTYHELYTLAELMHSKTSMEKKAELIGFLCRARQLFIRILAVVQWAGSTGTVDECDKINELLERRAEILWSTFNFLAELARDKLISARSPNFPIADSIDVLTLGTVNFLPQRLSEETNSFTPVTDAERKQALTRLQQILTARVATSDLPRQYSDVIIKNGRVTLRVDGEFEVKLGVTSDDVSIPWRVYKIDLFVQDPEEPEQELLHPFQIQALTNFAQSWLLESEKPFVDLYNYLHYYCQTLRLQILVEQAHRMRNRISKQKDFIITSYTPCKNFKIEYWKDFSANSPQPTQKKSVLQEKTRDIGMSIVCDDDGKFSIHHWPPLAIDDSVVILKIVQKPNITMEEIYKHTVSARSRRRFEDLKETLFSNTTGKIEIDLDILTMKCELLPESGEEEVLHISINPYSGLFRVISYMETRYSQQIEQALNREPGTLIEAVNTFKIWLIQQRIPSLLAHLNYRIYHRVPSLNPNHEMIQRCLNNGLYIEFPHHEGFYILIHVADTTQLLLQYYLLVVEKRSSVHEPLFIQERIANNSSTSSTSNEEGSKWILEPLLLCPLDTSAFLRREYLDLKEIFASTTVSNEMELDQNGDEKQAPMVSILSLKSLVKLVNYYDEVLTLTFLKDDFQRKKTICRPVTSTPWTGIPRLDIFRTQTGDDSFASKTDLANYITQHFWPNLASCTVRLIYNSRDSKLTERQWTMALNLYDNNYFHNFLVKTPFNAVLTSNQISTKVYGKAVDYFHHELRTAFDLIYLFDDYALSLTESPDLYAMAEVGSFKFFNSILRYGPNLAFSILLSYNPKNAASSESNGTIGSKIDLRFMNTHHKFLNNAHQLLSKKFLSFLIQTQSLKQLMRLLHMTSIPLALIGRLHGFNRSIVSIGPTDPAQLTVSLTPYTESRWRLIFAQIFGLDIQICGPNLIHIRDASLSIQSNTTLPELTPIPGLKEFLSQYTDDQGLSFEFYHITQPWRDEDFLPSSTAENSATPADPSSSTIESNPMGNFLNTFDPSIPIFNPHATFDMNLNRSGARSSNTRSYSLMDFGSNTNSTNNRSSSAQFSSTIAKSSSADTYEFLTDPIYANQTAPPSSGYDSDSLMDLMPDRSDHVTSNGKSSLSRSDRDSGNRTQLSLYFSQQTFFQMFYSSDRRHLSKFESFLAPSIFIRRFARTVQYLSHGNHQAIRTVPNEPDTYRIEHLYLQFAFEFDRHRLTYRIRLVSLPENPASPQPTYFWSSDELQLMETFFTDHLFPSLRLPQSANDQNSSLIDSFTVAMFQSFCMTFQVFARMLCFIQARVLKDLVKITEIEQTPDLQHLWRARWCLRLPENVATTTDCQPNFYQPDKSTFLFVFEFRPQSNAKDASTPPFLVPLIYDLNNNQTALWDESSKYVQAENEKKYELIKEILTAPRDTTSKNPCSLYPSINDLITRFETPS